MRQVVKYKTRLKEMNFDIRYKIDYVNVIWTFSLRRMTRMSGPAAVFVKCPPPIGGREESSHSSSISSTVSADLSTPSQRAILQVLQHGRLSNSLLIMCHITSYTVSADLYGSAVSQSWHNVPYYKFYSSADLYDSAGSQCWHNVPYCKFYSQCWTYQLPSHNERYYSDL